ncbi:MAG TPA: Gfo/Idh/MocA family oxidoreductase [Candidatus Eisenbacteria bacterium]|nr:Gfo/Idh/MocA family oxidoreductase [Candidatus Eisenbacteria bacterium]
MAAANRKLKLGIAGLGVGASEILPQMEATPEIELTAAADINPRVLATFRARYGGKTYDSVEKLCDDPDVEAVWIATPNRFHAAHTIAAATRGKHVVVEKPMALSLAEAERMIEAADKHNVKLLCGHTQSYGPHIRTMRRIVQSGQLGKLCAMHVWAYTDWMLRPRTAEELDIGQGGGVPYRQGPHQVDTLRLLGGGMVRSVRGAVGQWFPGRPIPGYYSAYLEFEDGTPATLMHNGYGYFLASELVPWGKPSSRYTAEERNAIRKSLLDGTRDEEAAKDAMRIGGASERAIFGDRARPRPWVPNDLGMLIVSCERGDMRQSEFGLYVYSDEGTKDVPLVDAGPSRRGELEELYNAVALGRPVRHTGRWGMATLEVCLAIMQSAREKRELLLSHQVPAPEES